MSDRLELRWPHKGEHVLQNPETGKWEFCGNAPLPFCPLIEHEAYGTEKKKPVADENSNLLIKGENLFALQALLRTYAGKVKLIYIDPPFNTGNDFEAYDDNFQHSVWLSMMSERLKFLYELLSEDGAIFVHIDNNEVGYLLVLMNERFRRKNFVQLISEKRASPAGFKTINPGPVTVTDYIFMYAKDKVKFNFKPMYVPVNYDENYDLFIENPQAQPVKWKFRKINDIVYKQFGFKSWREAKESWGTEWKLIRKSHAGQFALQNKTRVVSVRDPHKPSERIVEALEKSRSVREKVIVLEREDSEPIYILNGGALSFYTSKIRVIDGKETPTELLTDLWTDMNYAGIAEEGGVKFKNSKKPEMLLRRIIEMSTVQGDLVLDCFSGSGTSAAVAHKMQRHWICIEVMEKQAQDSVGRLQRVISGEDQTGISKQVGWKGGGGFRYLEVGAPLVVQDPETKLTILNPHYKNSKLVRAVCQMEGFALTGDGKYFHGRSSAHMAHITENFVDDAYVRRLAARLPEGYFLTIYGLKFQRHINRPHNVSLKRMQTSLVKPYLTKGA